MKRLVANGEFTVIRKAREFVHARYDRHITEVIKEIFDAIQPERFFKALKLDKIPGKVGDVYFVDYDDMTWYVKFILEDDEVRVRVLSCKWDGYPY